MYEIEKILDDFSKEHRSVILILKANVGYSAVLVKRDQYVSEFLMEEHYNGATVLAALKRLHSAELGKKEGDHG